MPLRTLAVPFALLIASCTASLELPDGVTVSCDSDAACPQQRRCLLLQHVCVDAAQQCVLSGESGLAAVEDGTICTKGSGDAGVCYRGICREPPCGDGVLDSGEACDDHNTVSGDGCSGDCGKIEVCGDGIVDAGEGCDDGSNTDPNDGCDACSVTGWAATLVLGNGVDGNSLADAPILGPVVANRQSRLYVGATHCRVLAIDLSSGSSTVIAGSGVCHSDSDGNGDGYFARGFNLGEIRAIALGQENDLYVVDANYIHRIDLATGLLSRIAGTGVLCASIGSCPSGVDPKVWPIGVVTSLSLAADGAIFYNDQSFKVIRKVTPDRRTQSIVIGQLNVAPTSDDEGLAPLAVRLGLVRSIASTPDGRVFVSDETKLRVIVADLPNNIVHHVLGTGLPGFGSDGASAAASATQGASFLVALRDGELLYRESEMLRKITADGRLVSLAGTRNVGGDTGDGGPALSATLYPSGVAALGNGDIALVQSSPLDVFALRIIKDGRIDSVAQHMRVNILALGQSATATLLTSMTDFDVAPNGDVFILHYDTVLRRDATTGYIERYAGGGTRRESGVPGVEFMFGEMFAIACLSNGDIVMADRALNVVYRIEASTKLVSVIAGTLGVAGSSGDGNPATSALLDTPVDIKVAENGDFYIYDFGNERIRKISGGVITSVASAGLPAYEGRIALVPAAVEPDIVVTDPFSHVLYRVRNGVVSNLAGTLDMKCTTLDDCGDDGPASDAIFVVPFDIDYDGVGIVIADQYVRRLDTVSADATVRRVAFGIDDLPYAGDGYAATNALGYARVIRRVDDAVFVGQFNTIRKIEPNGVITTVVGAVDAIGDGPAAKAELAHPTALLQLADGKWLITDGTGGRVRLLDEGLGDLRSVVGYQNGARLDATHTQARYSSLMGDLRGIARSGNTLFMTDPGLGLITTVTLAENPLDWTQAVYSDYEIGFLDGPVSTARFGEPSGIAVSGDTLWLADSGDHVVRKINLTSNEVTTLGGEALIYDFTGDDGPVGDAHFSRPSALAVNPADGSLYIADTGNNRIRRVIRNGDGLDRSSIIETVLGNGDPSALGSGAAARLTPAQAPLGLAFDVYGNLWVSSTSSVRIVNAGTDGIPTGEDVVQLVYGAAGSDFPASVTQCLSGIAARPGGSSVYVLDRCLGYLVRLDRAR